MGKVGVQRVTRRWRRSSFGRTRRLLEGSSIAADTAWKTLRVLSSRRSSKLGWETRDKLVLSSVRKALLTCMVEGSMSVQHKILETTELGGVVESSRCSKGMPKVRVSRVAQWTGGREGSTRHC